MAKTYVTVRGFKKGKLKFESVGLPLREGKSLKKDIVKHKDSRGGSWAKGQRFTIKKIR